MNFIKEDVAAQIRKEYESGQSITALAIKYEVVSAIISMAIKEAGGTMRPPGSHLKKKSE
ncbi:hypothetical protein [Candidatus Magnetaquicoccus inordinatus]|uniref:hypothetical protein n=1 Tax=Candidatus Magnetaquicoccus inordinatus TaxID=2496818 RepID=UPI00102D00E6|nr:hypothetical protein [Candidatus Magnetaquicoccus inordinatus]